MNKNKKNKLNFVEKAIFTKFYSSFDKLMQITYHMEPFKYNTYEEYQKEILNRLKVGEGQ